MDSQKKLCATVLLSLASLVTNAPALSATPPATFQQDAKADIPTTQELTADELYALAANQYGDQNWSGAAEQFKVIITKHPDSELVPKAKFYLGESLVQLNQNKKAEALFVEFLKQHPNSIYVKRSEFRLAECKYLGAEYDQAKTMFADFMKKHGEDPLAEFALPYIGELHLRSGNHDEARKAYQESLRRFPGSALSDKCRLGLAQSLHRLGNFSEARRFYRFLADQFTNPLGDDARLMLGKSFAEKNNWTQAKQEFDLVVRKYPESDLKVEAKYLIAKMEMLQGNWQASWNGMQPLLNEKTNDALFGKLGLDAAIVAVRVNELHTAKNLIERLRTIKTTDSIREFAAVLEIDIANREKDLDTLSTTIVKFEKDFPNSVHITRCIEPLARMHYDNGDYEKSAKRYDQLIGLITKRPDLIGNLPAWRYLLGLSYIGTDQNEKALAQLQQIKNFGGQQTFEAATSFAIATALSALNRHGESIPNYEKYLQLNPTGEDAVRCSSSLAIALVKSGNLPKAITTIDPVLNSQQDRDSILAACEVVAESALKANDKTTATRFFNVLAKSGNPRFASRGTNGLIWSGDDNAVSPEQLDNVIQTGLDDNLVAEAVIAKVQRMQAENKHQEAIDVLNKVIKAYPKSPLIDEAKFRLAISMQRLGGEINSRSAVTLLEEFLESKPKHKLVDLARYELAWARHDSADIQGARDMFQTIATEYTDSEFRIDSAYRTAMLYKQVGKEKESTEWLQKMLQWAPQHHLASYGHYSLGENLGANNKWSDAINHFEKTIELTDDPKLKQPAQYWLAESLYQTGQLDKAENNFEELKSVPFPENDIRSVIWLRLAQCAARRADWSTVNQIITELRNSTEIQSDSWQLDYLQGRVLMSRAQLSEARKSFGKVLQAQEAKGTQTAAMSQWMIGESWFHQEDYKEALRAYLLVDSIYDYDQWRALALLQAAKCHVKLGDSDQAKITCERMIESFPGSSHVVQARTLMREIAAVESASNNKTLPAKHSEKLKPRQ